MDTAVKINEENIPQIIRMLPSNLLQEEFRDVLGFIDYHSYAYYCLIYQLPENRNGYQIITSRNLKHFPEANIVLKM